eukprot:gb/GECH01013598.1/.p1 GENE.gb/GECH01013598.1/~~gb/GECH01013598.1/.p1  ORF type:complete len:509 (+),score=132.06 gb/GECH01013598.1/:1-1527(+)
MRIIKQFSAEHKDFIHDVAFDFYGRRIATCSSDQCLSVWDYEGGEWRLHYQWKAHKGSVWRVAWAHPEYGQILASCSYDRSVVIWEEPPHPSTHHLYHQQQQQYSQNNNNNNESSIALMILVKVASKKQTWCEQVILNPVNQVKLEKGAVKHIAGNDEDEGPDESIDYRDVVSDEELKPKYTGKTDNIVDRSLGKTVKRHSSEGTSDIDLTLSSVTDDNLQHFVEANSYLDKNPDGSWDQTFTIPALTFVNKGSENASVVSIRMQYQDQDQYQDEENGEWKDAVKTLLGTQLGWGQYSWFEEGHTGLNLPPSMTDALVVRGVFRQNQGSPGRDNFTRMRAASHLPQPLPLRVVIEDNQGRQRWLVVEQLNRPLGLPTAQDRASSWRVESGELNGFVSIDDHDATQRIYAALYKAKEGGTECAVLRFSHGTYFQFNKKIIKKFEFQAQEEDRSAMELSNQSRTESNGREWKTTALFDKDNVYKMYAIRFRVATKDGAVEQTCLMPKLKE